MEFDRLVHEGASVRSGAGGTARRRRVAHAAVPGRALDATVPDDALSLRAPGDLRVAWDVPYAAALVQEDALPERSTHAWMGPDGLVIPLFKSSAGT